MAHTYSGRLFSLKKEENSDILMNFEGIKVNLDIKVNLEDINVIK